MTKKKIDSLKHPNDLRRQAEEIAREKAPQLSENLDKLSPEEQWQLHYELQVHQIELTMQNESLRRTQEELESSRVRYFNLYDLAPVGYFTQNKEELILEANLKAGSLLGVARNTLVKKSLTRFIFREDQDIYYHHRQQLFETGTLQVCELRLVKKDGSLFWARLEATVAQDSESGAILYYTVISDITERKQMEEETRLHAAMMDHIAEGIYLMDVDDFLIKWTNNRFAKMFGYEPGEMVGKHVDILNAPTERTPAETRISVIDILNKTGEWHGEVSNIKCDGTPFWCYASASLFDHSEYGKVMVAVHTDITKRKQVEEALHTSEARYRLLVENANEVILVAQDGMLKFVNRMTVELMGYSEQELTSRPFPEFIHPDDRGMVVERHLRRLKGDVSIPRYAFRWVTRDGSIKWVEIGAVLIDWEGKPATLNFLNDVTERKLAEEQLQQSYQRAKRAMDATLETISKIVEVKDPYTAGHQQRVSQLATAIAKELNFSEDKIEGIRIASLIHDIGKISVPTEILSKSTTLSDIEFSLIKEHSRIGYDILKAIDFSYPVAKIVLQHHERLDGSGYPNNLKGDKILLEAKIICVADVVEAMSSHRPYRPALGIDKALEEISKNKGIFYDTKVVDVCLKLFKEKGFKFE